MSAPTARENIPHVQAKFFTKQLKYSVPDNPFSVPASVGVTELSTLINSLLQPDDDQGEVLFDFLVDGEFLRVSLQEHIDHKEISTEVVLDIEYVERCPAPQPEDSLLHDDWVSSVHAMADYILSGCYDNTARIWNTEGDLLVTIPGHSGVVKCVSWINNEEDNPIKSFVTGSQDETALLWQWNQNRNAVDCVHMCRGHAGSVDCVAVNQSKTKFCSGSWDKMLKIWSVIPTSVDDDVTDDSEKPTKRKRTDTAKIPARVPQMTLSGHNEGVSSTLWLSDTEICTASWDHTIRIWDVQQGVQKSTLAGTKVFMDVAWSPLANQLVAASADRHIRLYDPRITDGAIVKGTLTSHTGWVTSVAWSPVDPYQFISGSYDNVMKLWDTRSPKAPLYDMAGHNDKVLAVDWTMPQYMLSGSADNSLKIFISNDRSNFGH